MACFFTKVLNVYEIEVVNNKYDILVKFDDGIAIRTKAKAVWEL
jgi:hypothetical protein